MLSKFKLLKSRNYLVDTYFAYYTKIPLVFLYCFESEIRVMQGLGLIMFATLLSRFFK
jgi:hypothetical protein